MKQYVCEVCGYIYDEAAGDPDNGVAPGTKWEDLPADWVCPLWRGQGSVQRPVKNKKEALSRGTGPFLFQAASWRRVIRLRRAGIFGRTRSSSVPRM